jgi:hypothetical protein
MHTTPCPTHPCVPGCQDRQDRRVLAILSTSLGAVLLLAAEMCDDLLVRDILQIDPSLVDIMDKDGNTPLAKAAWKGGWECVHVLLAYGSDPERQNHFGYTPMMHALKAHHEYVLNILLTSESVYGHPGPKRAVFEEGEFALRAIIQPVDEGFLYVRTWGTFDRPTVDRLHALEDICLTSSLLETHKRVVCFDVNGFDGDICAVRQAKEASNRSHEGIIS